VIELAAHGLVAAVVNDQVAFAASALPATSLTRGSVVPPRTVTMYVVETDSALLGTSVAVRDAALYDTVAGTSTFEGLRSSIVLVLMVLAVIASLNVTVTAAAVLTPVAPDAGVREEMVGAVVSGPELAGVNTTSAQ
jgi:hypothetical protein